MQIDLEHLIQENSYLKQQLESKTSEIEQLASKDEEIERLQNTLFEIENQMSRLRIAKSEAESNYDLSKNEIVEL